MPEGAHSGPLRTVELSQCGATELFESAAVWRSKRDTFMKEISNIAGNTTWIDLRHILFRQLPINRSVGGVPLKNPPPRNLIVSLLPSDHHLFFGLLILNLPEMTFYFPQQ